MYPRLATLIVLNWKDEASTARCVASLRMVDRADECAIVVVDNESTSVSREALEALGVEVIPLPTNSGFAGGMNAGIRAARSEYIALFNNDLVVDSSWLATGLRLLEQPKVGMVGGHAIEWDGISRPSVNGEALALTVIDPERGYGILGLAPPVEREVAGLDGSNILARTELLQRLGGFDEAYFAYGEDIDLSARVLNAGYDLILTPSMKVWHKRGNSSDRIPYKRAYLSRRNQCFTIAKHFPAQSWWRVVIAQTLDNAARGVLGTHSGMRGWKGSPRLSRESRVGMVMAAAWVASHPHKLIAMRRRAIAKGQHVENYRDKLRAMARM